MSKYLSSVFEYETPKVVQIENPKIGLIHRIIQLIILIYCVCWVMIYERGYQDNDTAISSISTKVKGVGYSEDESQSKIKRPWDTADYVIPPLENNAFFVLTNIVKTNQQSISNCTEFESRNFCETDADCEQGKVSKNGHLTGNCDMDSNTCMVRGWCPAENDRFFIKSPGEDYTFPMVDTYTVLIKNDIEFPKFNVKRRNIQPWASKRFFKNCSYNKTDPEFKFCPIITFKTIFKEAKVDKNFYIKGGVIGVRIDWECNLDYSDVFCNPTYSFHRLDDSNAKVGDGFNFRYANYYRTNGTLYRDLIKAHGVRFIIYVNGNAGKFNFLPFTMNIGSSLALMGLAPTLCDFIVLNLFGSRKVYKNAKFQTVQEPRKSISKLYSAYNNDYWTKKIKSLDHIDMVTKSNTNSSITEPPDRNSISDNNTPVQMYNKKKTDLNTNPKNSPIYARFNS